MKRFLACVATAIAVCLPSVPIHAEDDDSAGRVRLSQDTAPPPPVPHAIGSDQSYGGPVYDNGGQYPLPTQSPMYQEYMGGSEPSGSVGYQLSDDIFTVQYRLNRRFGSLYGYEDSYTDIGMFIPRIIDNNSILFADLRGFITDDRDGGFNFGFGHRRYNAAADRVWSNAFWLDYDSGHVKDYFRGGYSGSMTSRFWRYRWNGYWIMNDQNNFIGTSFGDSAYYRGNNIVMDRTRLREVAYGGFDATIGGPIPLLGQYGLNWDFGLYYNTARHGEDGVGFIAKADAQITEDVQLGVSFTDDKVFGSNAQMYLSINLPDGRPSRIMRQPRVHDYMLRSDDRNYRVATKRYQVNDTVAMQNECLEDYNIAHIIPDAVDGATPTGDGSIDNPFNSLAAWEALTAAEKAAFDIILVRPGSEMTSSLGDEYHANLNTGITIFENHRLLASTGRLVRSIEGDDEVIRWAGHEFNAYVDGRAGLNSYILPGTDDWAGREYDPFNDDPRPILTNHITMAQYQADSLLNPAVMYNVVTIDGNFSASCAANPTEVSGFIVDGSNPNLPTILNSGIVSGIYTDPLVDRAINSFDINSNAVVDTVHAINIISANNGGPGYTDFEGDTVGRVDLNIVQGAGFRSNSGIHVEHIEGEMKLSVSDNVVFGVFGEDIDNDGWLLTLPGGHLSEDGINRENGKLDGGEDINGDGMISVNEDNDRDGVLGSDDHGIAINVIANGPNALIKANYADITLADGTVIPGYNISRNTTYVSEAEAGTDLNGYVTRKGSPLLTPPIPANTNTADTVDIIGNRSGINLEAINGGTLRALVADNDTSHNNPWADRDVNGNFTPPEKNEDMLAPPVPRLPLLPELDGNGIAVVDGGTGPTSAVLSNGFGIRIHADGVGSQVEIDALNRHTSNNNYGNGAVFSARNGGQVDMLSPLMGEVILNNDGKIVEVTNPSEFNNNGLNGLLISADGPDSSLSVLIGVPQGNFMADDATTSGNEASLVNDVFSRVLNTFNGNGTHFASGYSPDAFENGNGITIDLRDGASLGQIKYRDVNGNLVDSGVYSAIYHAQMNSNRANGLLIDLGDDVSPNGAWLQNFTVDNSDISGNGLDGISISAENLNDAVNPADLANGIGALHNLRITNNIISANGTNGINFQLENSDLTSPVIQGNQITALLQSPDVESLFDIDLVFGAGFSAQQRAAIAEAAERWSRAIIGDLPDVMFNGEQIDDIRIMVSSEAIDGDLGILAVGGFSFANLRDDGTELPYLASITFDEADMSWMEDNNILFDVAVHEMGHALGFLTPYWERPSKDLVAFNTATDPRFTGANATATYNSLFGVDQNGVPLESDGNNIAGSHWRESVFGAEIMTPYVNPAPNPLSGVTIAAMQDLGYTVNMNARDLYTPGQGTVQTGNYQLSTGQVTAAVVGTAEMVKLADHVVVVDPSVFDTTNLGSAGNGINLSVNNSNLVKVLIEDNNIHDNNGEGIRLVTPQFRTQGADAADMVNVAGFNTIVYSLNTINNNGGHGINMILDNGNRLDTVICVNDISGNELGGINVELTDHAYYDNGTFDGVVVGGVPYANGNSFSGNTVNDNGGIGYSITAKDNSQFELIGSSPVHSTINRNQEAGIGIVMTENTVGTIELDNITIDGNMDSDAGEFEDVNKLFDGDGFGLIMSDNALVNNLRIGSNNPPSRPTSISGNSRNGVYIKAGFDSVLFDPVIQNSDISENGLHNIHVYRTQSALIGDNNIPDVANPTGVFTITGNRINDAGGHGIYLIAEGSNMNDEYLISENLINGNGWDGIHLETNLNARIVADILFNQIDGNSGNGIHTTGTENNAVDQESSTGNWLGNRITNNERNGININTVYGLSTLGIQPLVIGSTGTDAQGRSYGNLIAFNGKNTDNILGVNDNDNNGIRFGRTGGYANIVNNDIYQNGNQQTNIGSGIQVNMANSVHTIEASLNRIDGNAQHGVNINNNAETGGLGAHIVDMVLDSNIIQNNGRDGVQILSSAFANNPTGSVTNGSSYVYVTIQNTLAGQDSIIRSNGGRGVDTLARGRGQANVTIYDTLIRGNGEEGVYTVITTAIEQSNEVAGNFSGTLNGVTYNQGLTQSDTPFGIPLVVFEMDNTVITNNNGPGGFGAGGLVFRVGTSGAAFTNNNANNSTWAQPGTVDPFAKGGLVASVDNSYINNNGGVDVLFHTFASTVDPPTTGGTWSDNNNNPRTDAPNNGGAGTGDNTFNPTSYQQDPVARILIESFNGNSGGSIDVFGASMGSSNNETFFASYNNNESVFKSRGITGVGPDTTADGGIDDNGPFLTGTRLRNATRLASRTGYTDYYYDPITGTMVKTAGAQMDPQLNIIHNGRQSDNFLYPGMGDSTLRIRSGSDLNLFGFEDIITNFTTQVGFNSELSGSNFRNVNYLYDVIP